MARKITTSTDKYGRTVYKITGTKKYAFSLVKAKKIAASLDGTSVRKPAKKTAAKKTARKTTRRPAKKTTALARVRKPAKRTVKRTAAKRNASGQFVKRKAAKKTTRRNTGKAKISLAQTKAVALAAYRRFHGTSKDASLEAFARAGVDDSVRHAGYIGGDLYDYLASNPALLSYAMKKFPELAAKGGWHDSGHDFFWEPHV